MVSALPAGGETVNAYIYQAALLCEDCGRTKADELRPAMLARDPQFDETDERTYDSDDFPKGPVADGGGEANTTNHCDSCGVFLENPLTADGRRQLSDEIAHALDRGMGALPPELVEFREFYGIGDDDRDVLEARS